MRERIGPARRSATRRTRDGFCLHFTGPAARSHIVDLVIDDIERQLSPPGMKKPPKAYPRPR